MFRLWIEWDFGQDNIIFSSRQNALDWFDALKLGEEMDEEELNFKSLEEQRLVSIQELTVI
jgi:hypothetical protein